MFSSVLYNTGEKYVAVYASITVQCISMFVVCGFVATANYTTVILDFVGTACAIVVTCILVRAKRPESQGEDSRLL